MKKAYIMFICYILTIVSPFMLFYDDSSHFDWILVMMCSSCANRLHENCVHRWTDKTRGKLCATWSRHSETRFINLTVIPDEDKLTLYRNKRILQLWFSHSVLFIFFLHALVVLLGCQRKQHIKLRKYVWMGYSNWRS